MLSPLSFTLYTNSSMKPSKVSCNLNQKNLPKFSNVINWRLFFRVSVRNHTCDQAIIQKRLSCGHIFLQTKQSPLAYFSFHMPFFKGIFFMFFLGLKAKRQIGEARQSRICFDFPSPRLRSPGSPIMC